MKSLVCALVVLLASCGGDEHSKPDCAKTDRDGTYRVTSSYNGGSCGALDTFYVYLDSGSDVTNGCITTYEEWSNEDCTLQRSLSCTFFVTDSGTGTSSTVTANWSQISTQQDDEGNTLYGNASLNQQGSGGFSCTGTYFLNYTRVSR